MFIQMIHGKVRDEAGLRECMMRWQRDLEPGAEGYLGTTSGMCDDGSFIALARFTDRDAAMRNSQRPEQGAWWAETERCFDGPVTFHDCNEAESWLGGGSDDAGFVQIMSGHSSDRMRMHKLMTDFGDRLHELRPEIIGGIFAGYDDDGYVDAVYFRSEAEAREHEKMPIPDDLQSMMAEEMSLMGQIEYFDLHQPMLVSASR